MEVGDNKTPSVTVGRYMLHRQIARGGMATIHLARLLGDEGFSRIVAAKRLLPELAEDTEFVAMFLDEARIASKVHHPNVVSVLDLVTTSDEVMLVQEYVHGVPLHVLLRTAQDAHQRIPVRIAVSIATQILAGLQAAHTTVDEMGVPLRIIHRDVSPQNVMIAADGSARLLDFGVAKTTIAAHVTRDGTFKGKLAYSAPEQVRGKAEQQSDLYSLAVVLWELLVGHRMHGTAQSEAELVATILGGTIPTITEALSNQADWGAIDSDEWQYLAELDPLVQQGLAVEIESRFQFAVEMEEAIAKVVPPASTSEIAAWLKVIGKDFLDGRDKIIAAEEASWRKLAHPMTSSRRLTPVPGLPRPSKISTVNTHVTMPQPSEGRGGRMIVGVLGALVILLGVGVVFAVQAASDTPPAQTTSPTIAESSRTPPASEPNTAPAAAAPADHAPMAKLEARPAALATTTATTTTRKSVVKRAPPVEPAAAAPAPDVVAAPAPAAPPVNDCSPPYYFEGQKKVFKPQCL